MKKVLLLLAVLITLSFNYFPKQNENDYIKNNNGGVKFQEIANLRLLATNYNPKQLNLTNSIIENIELNKFLTITDKKDIISSPDFDFFITIIILKQYEFHLTKFHQGFDLFSMKAGNAGFIVSSFLELTKLPEGTKGINSGYVLDYIAANDTLKNDKAISEIVNKINVILPPPIEIKGETE